MGDVQVVVIQAHELVGIREEIAALRDQVKPMTTKRWYTLREAAELKGISIEVLRKLPRWHRPNCGRSTSIVHGSRKYNEVYRDTDVVRWLDLGEDALWTDYQALLGMA